MKFQTKEDTQKIDFLGTSNSGYDMRLSPQQQTALLKV
jgi:hypothetical protein